MNATQDSASARRLCPQCGTELPGNLPPEFCPRCLLKAGLAPQPQTGPKGTIVVSAEHLSPGLPQPGEELGHYRIVRSLGGGGMGTVFEAEDLENGRRVALKVLSQALDSPAARQRFFREGRLAASINHPNSVYVFGTEELGGIPLITMELVAGGTLEDRVRTRGPMPPTEAVDAALQIIAGLEAAQRFGILHRDVKPSNCFVDTGGTVKIGDFGLSISTAVRTETALTAAGSFLGTPAFCSPEQLRGEELNARADMYSVGATLFYLLTGHAPFQARNAVALIATVLEQPAPSPRQFQPKLARGVARVVRRCLEKQPGERFKNYEELRQALAPYGSTAPVPANLGLRFAAGILDLIVLSVCIMTIATVATSRGPNGRFAPFDFLEMLTNYYRWTLAITLAADAGFVLYFTLMEGLWGLTLGKLVCGLRVVGPDNNPPGVLRALPRPLLCLLAPALPYCLLWETNRAAMLDSHALQDVMSFSFYLLLAVVFSTVRRKNGFAAVHDLVTKTRVVARTALQVRSAPAVVEASPPAIEAMPLIGPYHVLDTVANSADGAWLVGYDLRLLRKVWIHTVPTGTPPVPAPWRNLGRVGRLRWLSGRRSAEENWDAFEAASGQPLLLMLRAMPQELRGATSDHQAGKEAGTGPNPQPWEQVRFWLCDLATEISAAQKDGTLPPILALDRVWITGDGRAKLLDFPAPGILAPPADLTQLTHLTTSPADSASPQAPTISNIDAVPRFLGQIAAAALEGRPESAAKSASEVSLPLPLHVRQFFKALPQLIDADALLLALRPLLPRVAVVTRKRRAAMVAGCLAFPLFCACSILFGGAFLKQWNGHNPGVFELNQVLQARTMRQWATTSPSTNQSGPTDAQFAIYISSHYQAAITNIASWSNAVSLSLINGEGRRFAEQSLVQHPAPTANEIAEADDAIKKVLRFWNVFDLVGKPSFALLNIFVSLGVYVCLPALIASLAFRGGLVLLLMGVTFVRRDGAPASRLRLFWRALIAWSPFLVALVLSFGFLAAAISPDHSTAGKNLVLPVLAFGLLGALTLVSIVLPQRGLQDRLAGTWPVPR